MFQQESKIIKSMPKRMKIGFVLPGLALTGGIKRFASLSSILSKKGYNITIYSLTEKYPDWWLNKNITHKNSKLSLKDDNEFLIFHNPCYTDYKLLKKSKAKYNIIYIVNNANPYKKEYQRWINKNKKKKNLIVAGNNGLWKDNYETYNLPTYNFIGGIDLEKYYPVKTDKDKDYFNIVIQGNFDKEWKGTRQIIKALEELKEREKIKLIIFSNKNFDIKTKLKIEKKINIPQEKMKYVYSKKDLFIHFEDNTAGWSNTSAEAMACKLPVICTKYGTTDFAIHNKTAYVIKRNEEELKKAVKTIIQNKELRQKLAEAGHKKIKEFSWEKLADKIEKTITKMPNKISNIGFNKAGSTSLTKAMRILGFKSLH